MGDGIAETHTGRVILVGDRAYKVKKPVVTDFLDFSTPAAREQACADEVALNRRLAPDSYLGVGHFTLPGQPPEPVIVMRRHPEDRRLATLVRGGGDVDAHLEAIAAVLAAFHAVADRGPAIEAEARAEAVAARWAENLAELARYASSSVPEVSAGAVERAHRLVEAYLGGRAALFEARIAAGRVVDGHADLLADDIFCLPDGPAMLDCLEFDDRLRYVDVIDDAAFLAMDLEYLGRPDLGQAFLAHYRRASGDDAPESLSHFYIAYRAVVRAKVDCVRVGQGHPEAAQDARRHLGIAVDHLRHGAVRLVIVGGGPGTGKTTVARGLADPLGAVVISTDDVRAAMAARGEIAGLPGVLGEGLYTAANIEAVYAALLQQARQHLALGRSVILDGTWADAGYRDRAHELARDTGAVGTDIACAAGLATAVTRIDSRHDTTSQVTPEIATALADRRDVWPGAHRLDTTGPVDDTIAQARDICLAATP